jgi:hypothetical protein
MTFDRSRRDAAATVAAIAILSWLARPAEAGNAGDDGVKPTVSITAENYRGWPRTYRLSNGLIEARVVTAIGPRIVDLRAAGGPNLFYLRDAEAGGTGEEEWKFRGGWRLWVSPERRETTYALDNASCEATVENGATLRVTAPPQPAAGIRKEVEIALAPGERRLRLTSHARNIGDRPLRYALWSLSALRPGGRAFAPLDVGPLTAFDAVRKLLLWSYAEIADPRYRLGDHLVEIDHSKVAAPPAGQTDRRDDESKIGVDSAQGWAAYLLDGTLYLERFPHDGSGDYPDGGATVEIYSSAEFLELENLGPLTTIAPGEEITLREDWWLFPEARVGDGESAALADLRRYVDRTPSP